MQALNKKNIFIYIFNFTVLGLCIYFLYKYLFIDDLVRHLKAFSLFALVLSSLPLIIAIIIDSLRFYIIAQSVNYKNGIFLHVARIKYCVSVFLTSMSMSFFVPGSIGVEGYRVIKLGKIISTKDVASSIITMRLINLTVLIIMVMLTLFYLPVLNEKLLDVSSNVSISQLGMILFLLFIIVIIYFKRKIYDLLRYYYQFLSQISLKKFFVIYIYSILIEVLRFISLYVIVRSIGFEISMILLLGISALSTLSLIIPFTLNGIGVREALIVILLETAGIPLNVSISFAVIARIISLVPIMLGALLLAFKSDDVFYSNYQKSIP